VDTAHLLLALGIVLAATAVAFGVAQRLRLGATVAMRPEALRLRVKARGEEQQHDADLAHGLQLVGMGIGLHEVAAMLSQLAVYLPLMLIIKFVVLGVLALALRLGPRAAFLAGLLMMPFDEIGYVILASAHSYGLLPANGYALGLAMISFSFVVSPPLKARRPRA
jgi:hypothetical protein